MKNSINIHNLLRHPILSFMRLFLSYSQYRLFSIKILINHIVLNLVADINNILYKKKMYKTDIKQSCCNRQCVGLLHRAASVRFSPQGKQRSRFYIITLLTQGNDKPESFFFYFFQQYISTLPFRTGVNLQVPCTCQRIYKIQTHGFPKKRIQVYKFQKLFVLKYYGILQTYASMSNLSVFYLRAQFVQRINCENTQDHHVCNIIRCEIGNNN